MLRHPFLLIALRCLALILLLGNGPESFSQKQEMKFSHLGSEQGLSQSNVNCILQDSRGFMWFGTRDGLNKYDGYQFKVYKNGTDNPKSISDNNVSSIIEGKKGELWIATLGGGLNRFDREKDLFTHYRQDKTRKNVLSDDFINCLMQDSKGNIWIGTNESGLDILDPVTGQFSNYGSDDKDPHALSDNCVKHIFEDSRHRVWISTSGGGLDLFDKNTRRFTRFLHNEKDNRSIASNLVWEVFEDSRHRIWIGTNDGLDLLDSSQNIFYHYRNDPRKMFSLVSNAILALGQDRDGRLWAGTDNEGISILNSDNTTFQTLRHDPVDNSSPGSNSICSIYKDHQGNMWVGTFCNGVDMNNSDANKFTHYRHDSSPKSLGNNYVLDLFEDSGENLWVGTDGGGMDLLDRKTGDFRHFKHNPADKNSICGNYVLTVFEDKEKDLWAGTWADGITVIDRSRSSFRQYKNDPADSFSLSGNNVYAITADKDKEIWIGTYGSGLDLFDPGIKGFTRYKHLMTDPNSICSNNIDALLGDREGYLWIGTGGSGMDRFDKKTKIFTHFRHDPRKNSISNNSINALYEDSQGDIWICSCAGLNFMDRRTGQFTVYGAKDGLPNEVIFGILEDDKGYLWVSTGNGLSKFDPRKKSFTNFSVADGVQSGEFKPHSCYKSRSGALFFGGINGFNEFFPDSIKSNTFDPVLLITGFRIFNKDVPVSDETATSPLTADITETKEITLSYQQSVISFEFASLNYTPSEKKQYAYMLEGFDQKWNNIGMKRAATYTNLDAGQYTFKVKGLNNNGTWSPGFTSIRIIITPPFWQTWWFRILAVLVMLGAAVGVHRIRIAKLRARQTRLEREVQEQTGQLTISITEERRARQEAEQANEDAEKARLEAERANRAKSVFLATMSHEIRTPMNGVLGMASLLGETTLTAEQEDYTDTIRTCGETLMNVINDILDFSKIESGKMELEQKAFDLRTCIEEVLDVFAGKAGQAGLDLVYQIGYNVPSKIIGDDMRLKQVLMNLVSNAIKFTHEGEVFLSVHLSSAGAGDEIVLAFEIRDTGIGIPADKVDRLFQAFSQVDSSTTRKYGGTGLGLVICEKLIRLMGGVIEVKSQPGKGTAFIFTLPTRASIDSVRSYINMAGLERKQVLVVDDNLTNRNILQSQLLQWKLTPTLAASGKEALAILSEHPDFDLVISDLLMPDMDGIELAESIRQSYPGLPIILLSSVSNENGKYDPALFRSVLNKPVRQQILSEHIRNAFRLPDAGLSSRLKQHPKQLLPGNLSIRYPMNILVAEDNLINQKLITHILHKLGYEPGTVDNGTEALQATTKKRYDLILMDVQMPEMDGLEATRAIRLRKQEQPVIIALTANAMQGDMEQCLESGMDDYLSKPVQLEDLVSKIEKWALHAVRIVS